MKPYRPIKSNFIQYIRNCGWSACAKDTYKISCRSVSSIESFASKIASVAEIGDVILLSGFVIVPLNASHTNFVM